MIYEIKLSERAKLSMSKSYAYYEEKQKDLGFRFVRTVESTLERIRSAPNSFPEKKNRYRQAVINTFSFVIIFFVNEEKNEIAVLDVFHTSQDPQKKP